MSSLAQEIMDAMPPDLDMVPMKVVSLNPLRVVLAGSSKPVPATSPAGITLTVGAVGFAFWKPPTPPFVIAVQGATGGGSSGGGSGGGGSGSTNLRIYAHTQSTVSYNWTIDHNLGHNPIVEEVITSDGSIAEGFDIIQSIPGSQTILGFDIAISGNARLV